MEIMEFIFACGVSFEWIPTACQIEPKLGNQKLVHVFVLVQPRVSIAALTVAAIMIIQEQIRTL